MPWKEEYEKARGEVSRAMSSLYNRARELDAANDTVGVKDIAENIKALEQRQVQLQQQAQEAVIARQNEILNGLESGEAAGYEKQEYGHYDPMTATSVRRTKLVKRKDHKDVLRSNLAELIDADPQKIDIENGIDADQMILVKGFSEQEGKVKALQSFYETAQPIKILGKENFLLGDNAGNYRLAYTEKNSGADIGTGALMGGTKLVLSALMGGGAAGIAKSSLGKMAAGSLAGSGSYSLADAVIEAPFSQLVGEDYNVGDKLKNMAKEAGGGLLFDAITMGIGSKFTKYFGKGIKNKAAVAAEEAIDLVNKESKRLIGESAEKIDVPPSIYGGKDSNIRIREIAGTYGNTAMGRKIGNKYDKVMTQLSNIKKALVGEAAPEEVRKQTFDRIQQEDARLAKIASGRNERAEKVLAQAFADRRDTLTPQGFNVVEEGKSLYNTLSAGNKVAKDRKTAGFNQILDKADQEGLLITPKEMYDNLLEARMAVDFGENPKIDEVLNSLSYADRDSKTAIRLRQRAAALEASGRPVPFRLTNQIRKLEKYSQPFNAERARSLVKDLQSMVPDNMIGTTDKDALSQAAAKAARNTLEGHFKAKDMLDEWEGVKELYTQNYLAPKKTSIGQITKEEFGNPKMAYSKMIKSALADEKSVNDVLTHVRSNLGDAEAENTRQLLKNAYLNKITSSSKPWREQKAVDLDEVVVDALWGKDSWQVKQAVADLNDVFKKSKTPLANITPEDMVELSKPMSTQQRAAFNDSILKRNKAIEARQALLNNSLISEAKKGNYSVLDNDAFASSLLNAKPSEVEAVMKKIPAQARKGVESDFLSGFFRKYIDEDTATRHGSPTFDSENMLNDLGGWKWGDPNMPKQVANMMHVIGPEKTKLVYSTARAMSVYSPIKGSETSPLRFVQKPTGETSTYIANLPQRAWHRILAAAHGSGKLDGYLKAISKDIGAEALERNNQLLVSGMLGSRLGLKAYAEQSRNDPEFSEELAVMLNEVAKKQVE